MAFLGFAFAMRSVLLTLIFFSDDGPTKSAKLGGYDLLSSVYLRFLNARSRLYNYAVLCNYSILPVLRLTSAALPISYIGGRYSGREGISE